MRLHVLLPVAVSVIVALNSAPASARPDDRVNSGAVTIADGVLYPGCAPHEWQYTFNLDDIEEGYGNILNVDVTDGGDNLTEFVYFQNVPLPSGTLTTSLCSTDVEGKFNILVNISYTDHEGQGRGFTAEKVYFTMRDAHTKTKLAASTAHPADPSTVTLTARSSAESATGYSKLDSFVELQQLRAGKWTRVATKAAGEDGKVTFKVKYAGGAQKYRAETKQTSEWTKSTSTIVKLS